VFLRCRGDQKQERAQNGHETFHLAIPLRLKIFGLTEFPGPQRTIARILSILCRASKLGRDRSSVGFVF
jgi:hypothetical protein